MDSALCRGRGVALTPNHTPRAGGAQTLPAKALPKSPSRSGLDSEDDLLCWRDTLSNWSVQCYCKEVNPLSGFAQGSTFHCAVLFAHAPDTVGTAFDLTLSRRETAHIARQCKGRCRASAQHRWTHRRRSWAAAVALLMWNMRRRHSSHS